MVSLRKHYSIRYVGLLFVLLLFATVCIYYGNYSNMANMTNSSSGFGTQLVSGSSAALQMKRKADYDVPESWIPAYGKIMDGTCSSIPQSKASIETIEEYSKFEFEVRCIDCT